MPMQRTVVRKTAVDGTGCARLQIRCKSPIRGDTTWTQDQHSRFRVATFYNVVTTLLEQTDSQAKLYVATNFQSLRYRTNTRSEHVCRVETAVVLVYHYVLDGTVHMRDPAVQVCRSLHHFNGQRDAMSTQRFAANAEQYK